MSNVYNVVTENRFHPLTVVGVEFVLEETVTKGLAVHLILIGDPKMYGLNLSHLRLPYFSYSYTPRQTTNGIDMISGSLMHEWPGRCE
jgi:hypothetical protein